MVGHFVYFLRFCGTSKSLRENKEVSFGEGRVRSIEESGLLVGETQFAVDGGENALYLTLLMSGCA